MCVSVCQVFVLLCKGGRFMCNASVVLDVMHRFVLKPELVADVNTF